MFTGDQVFYDGIAATVLAKKTLIPLLYQTVDVKDDAAEEDGTNVTLGCLHSNSAAFRSLHSLNQKIDRLKQDKFVRILVVEVCCYIFVGLIKLTYFNHEVEFVLDTILNQI